MLSQQEIELRLLHEKHIENMLALEKERLLLNRENPYKQTFSYERNSDIEDRSKLPILKPDRVTEKMLYYPPTHKEGEIAGSQLNLILSSWNRDCMNFPKDIVFNKMIKYNSNIDFEQRLTERGLEYIDEELKYAMKRFITRPQMTIKQKYGKYLRGGRNEDSRKEQSRYVKEL